MQWNVAVIQFLDNLMGGMKEIAWIKIFSRHVFACLLTIFVDI